MRNLTGSIWSDPKTHKIYARVTYTNDEGKRVDKKRLAEPQTRTAARELNKQMIRELDEGGEKAFDASRITFTQAADFFEKHYLVPAEYVAGRKVNGLRTYEQEKANLAVLRKEFRHTPLRELTHGTIHRFKLKTLRTPVIFKDGSGEITGTRERSVASVNRLLSTLRRLFKVAMGESWGVTRDPFIGPQKLIAQGDEIKRERILLYHEEIALLSVLNGPREHLLPKVICARDTGMRKGEIESLMWQDIDILNLRFLIKGFDFVVNKAVTKTILGRVVPISDRLVEQLRKLAGPARWAKMEKGVLLLDRDLVFGNACIKTAWGTALREAGIEGFRFHDLRHTFGTRMQECGLESVHVSRLLGHSLPSDKTVSATTYRYTNITPEILERARQIINGENTRLIQAGMASPDAAAGSDTALLSGAQLIEQPSSSQGSADYH